MNIDVNHLNPYRDQETIPFMIPGFETIVEERIKKAQEKGEFKNLKGCHKPLTFDDMNVPQDLRLAYKILKNAGFVPPEVELKQKITQTRQLLEAAQADSPETLKIQKRLNWLLTRLAAAGKEGFSRTVSEKYHDSLMKKMS